MIESQQPVECLLCHGTKQILQYPKRTMGYTLTGGETLDEHLVPCPNPACVEKQPEGELELLPVNFMLTLRVTDDEFKAHCKKCTHSCDVYPQLCKEKLQIAKVWHKAQLAHDNTKYQELQGICNRLIQDNTELTEKLLKGEVQR